MEERTEERAPEASRGRITGRGLHGESEIVDRDWIVHPRFFELYDQMLGELSVPAVLNKVATAVTEAMDAEATTVYLVRPETRELEAEITTGKVPRTIRIPIDKTSLAGFCGQTGRAFLIEDAYGDLSDLDPAPRFDRSWDQAHGFRTRDVMCAPALFKSEIVGVVQVLNSRTRPFGAPDLAALQAVARLVGYALNQVRLYDDLATLKQLQREKAKFVRVMLHELKSPVAASIQMVDLLRSVDVPTEKRAQMLDRISTRLGS